MESDNITSDEVNNDAVLIDDNVVNNDNNLLILLIMGFMIVLGLVTIYKIK